MIETDNLDILINYLRSIEPTVIGIDGRDGAGKTYVATKIKGALGGTHLTEDAYREATLSGRFFAHGDRLLIDIKKNLNNPPIIFDSCFALAILKKLKIDNCTIIYIKRTDLYGSWVDKDEFGWETKEEALEEARRFSATNFRLQMIAYHYDRKPELKADIIFNNQCP